MLLLASLLCVVVMAGLGYLRGSLKFGLAFVALILASLLASPLSGLTGWLVRAFGVPALLVPVASTLVTGLLLFALFLVPLTLWARRFREDGLPSWDKPMGAVVGGVWRLLLVLLCLVGLTTIGRVDRAMREANSEVQLRQEARLKIERRVEKELRPLASTMSTRQYEQEKREAVAVEMEKFQVDPEELRKKTEPGPLDGMLVEVKYLPFGTIVEAVSPVNLEAETTLRELAIVVGDPVLLHRFKNHPEVRELMQDPTVRAISEDEEVALAVRQGRYRELLDHPKLVATLEDRAFTSKFSKVDIRAILDEVQNP